MFFYLYQFFYNLFNYVNAGGTSGKLNNIMSEQWITIGGQGLSGRDYFSFLATIISETIIVVLCCLFIYRLIRLVGRLFSGGNL